MDLTRTPERREEMVAASNERIIPQVHVNGKVRRARELLPVQAAYRCSAPAPTLLLLLLLQYIGNADLIQELEDFGQLDEVLRQP